MDTPFPGGGRFGGLLPGIDALLGGHDRRAADDLDQALLDQDVAALVDLVVRDPEVREKVAHRVLFRQGDPGDDMYVVIDGELVASVLHEDQRVELGPLRRGDTFGEVALFHGKRTADVHAVTDVRLLQISSASLERLGRRYPRIALKVTRNLSEILADHLAINMQNIR